LNLDEANGIMLGVAAEHDIALVSHAEHHIETLLEQLVKKGQDQPEGIRRRRGHLQKS